MIAPPDLLSTPSPSCCEPPESCPVWAVLVGSFVLWFLVGFGQWKTSAENQGTGGEEGQAIKSLACV